MRGGSLLVLLLFVVGLWVGEGEGLRQKLSVDSDERSVIFVDKFGFERGGVYDLTVYNFSVDLSNVVPPPVKEEYHPKMGYLLRFSQVNEEVFVSTEEDCPLLETDPRNPLDLFIPVEESKKIVYKHGISQEEEGFLNTFFINCEKNTTVSFQLKLSQRNKNGNYLPIGWGPLPFIYLTFFMLYLFLLVGWSKYCLKHREVIHMLHHLMGLLLFLKILTSLFKMIELLCLRFYGENITFMALFLAFNTIKGLVLFVFVGMVGSGVHFVKPHLSGRDKVIILCVIPLQLFVNFAIFVTQGSGPGAKMFETWLFALHIVDIFCCFVVMIPILWSLSHLREASSTDGKKRESAEKLKLFQEFYLLVLGYVYFTRVVMLLVVSSLSFQLMWLSDFLREFATFLFLASVCYMFRPNKHYIQE